MSVVSYPNKVLCKELRRQCRNCGYKHGLHDENQLCSQCGTDRTCNKPTVPNFRYCAAHGGPIPSRGKYGKDRFVSFPLVKLAERYGKMLKDARMLSVRASIEVVRGRIQQLAERIDFNDAPDRLEKLSELWDEYMDAKKAGKSLELIKLEMKLSSQFDKARADYAAWEQMMLAIDLDRKLVESEVKVVKEIKAILTAEDAYELIAKILAIILRIFPDDKLKLKQVQYEFTKLIGDQPVDIGNPGEHTTESVASRRGNPIDVEAENV